MVSIPKIAVGDTLELKKAHPCGTRKFHVLRVGSDLHIVCCGCGRSMTVERVKLEKAIKNIIHTEVPHEL